MSTSIVVFISGTGSNLRAILDAADRGDLPGAEVTAVIADCDAPGLEHARTRSIPTAVIPLAHGGDRDEWNRALAATARRYAPDLIVLAGFMRLLGSPMLDEFGGRIINTHPSLLPSFPGAHGVRDALAYGVKVTGATVISVDAGVDTGAIIDQRAVPVADTDDEPMLHEKIKQVERVMIVDVIARFLDDPASITPTARSTGGSTSTAPTTRRTHRL